MANGLPESKTGRVRSSHLRRLLPCRQPRMVSSIPTWNPAK
jgi:hypothetical protein